jgi:hypothetical protein
MDYDTLLGYALCIIGILCFTAGIVFYFEITEFFSKIFRGIKNKMMERYK